MEKDNEDDILSKRKFQNASGLNLGNFMLDTADEIQDEEATEALEEDESDVAMGELGELFSRSNASESINRDGTVTSAPEIDTVTEYAMEGEKRLHLGLMISMIVVWSAIGTIVGTVPFLGYEFSAIGLLLMAAFGIWLGEKWIPNERMHLLGVTWVIISMKLLYGLAISTYSWGWIGETELGITLLGLVGVNIAIAQHHNEYCWQSGQQLEQPTAKKASQ
jgi:hypothetical protein